METKQELSQSRQATLASINNPNKSYPSATLMGPCRCLMVVTVCLVILRSHQISEAIDFAPQCNGGRPRSEEACIRSEERREGCQN